MEVHYTYLKSLKVTLKTGPITTLILYLFIFIFRELVCASL